MWEVDAEREIVVYKRGMGRDWDVVGGCSWGMGGEIGGEGGVLVEGRSERRDQGERW